MSLACYVPRHALGLTGQGKMRPVRVRVNFLIVFPL